MDSANLVLVVVLVVLLGLSAFFSASETAFSSLNRVRLKSMAAEGNPKARRTLKLSQRYDKLLSTVLVGNNIVNILTSSLATVLFVGLFGNLGVTLATVVVTVLVLIVGEITPKTLAKEAPEKVAMGTTPVLRVLMVVLAPVNAVFSAWKKLVLKMFRLGGDEAISEQELLTYVEEVREDGTISTKEEEMIRSVIEFDDVQAGEICTPRVDIEAISLETPNEKISAIFMESGFSRLPVYRDSIDNIMGVLLEKDFHYYVLGQGQPLEKVARPPIYITKSLKISTLLSELQQKKTHMAVILDEYGGTLGIVTIEDVLEELVGEIWDEHDEVVEEIHELAAGRYRVYGGTDIEDVFALMGESAETVCVTAGGWVQQVLGHIPAAGEQFRYGNWRVTVEEMSRNRVVSVLVEAAPEEADEEEGRPAGP